MIKKFNILYSGHVELDNIGFGGTPANDRFLPDDQLASAMEISEVVAKTADRLGYNILWFAEHHFQREGYECTPNLLMLGLHLAHLTERLKIGCAFNVTPMWHPLRLAEDYAIVDHLTDGRIVFGVARGYHTREVETFGAPLLDKEANRDLFEEQVEIIFKAFNERSFSHHGKYYDIPPRVPYRGYELEEITLVPRPKYLPVECWQPIVSSSQRGVDFMAKHGIKAISGGGAAPGGASREVMELYQEALARVGRQTKLGEDVIVGIRFHMAETEEKAIEEVKPYHEEDVKMFAPFGFVPNLTKEQLEGLQHPTKEVLESLYSLENQVRDGRYMCGPPELIIERLKTVEKAYPGLEQINLQHPIACTREMLVEQLEWFATEVMPAFSEQGQ